MTVSSSWVPEVFSSYLLESMRQQTSVLRLLADALPDIQVDAMIMVCRHPWWLTWEEVVEPQPFSIHYIADHREP